MQKYCYLRIRAKNYVAKYGTHVSLQQIAHILQHFYHPFNFQFSTFTLRWVDVQSILYSI